MKMILTAAAALGFAIAIGGCSEAPNNEFEARSGDQEYDQTVGMASDLRAAGEPCVDFSINDVATYARESATCTLDGHEVILSIFESTEDQAANVQNFADINEPVRMEYGLLVGSKWMINCGDTTTSETCVNLQAKLGGELVKPNYG
ncbi:hypothetical protein [Rhodococcus globerulus]|uniref:hypothetical protein n=1 Tax=Rhodococcus globerulus TaxID=33008 RepID=UPI001C590BAB|nr:hypothetical protein [Rhodococcus globerulus]QXW03987.1 hypothetical protein KYT97_08195 [Rhodococcus globerulus]